MLVCRFPSVVRVNCRHTPHRDPRHHSSDMLHEWSKVYTVGRTRRRWSWDALGYEYRTIIGDGLSLCSGNSSHESAEHRLDSTAVGTAHTVQCTVRSVQLYGAVYLYAHAVTHHSPHSSCLASACRLFCVRNLSMHLSGRHRIHTLRMGPNVHLDLTLDTTDTLTDRPLVSTRLSRPSHTLTPQ